MRLFFALWPDTRARTALARLAAEVAHVQQGRPPREDSLHITLAFLGDVAEARLPDALAAGERAATSVDPFPVALERMGGTAYGIAWLTPDGVHAELRVLHEALATELAQRGFPRERRMFRPHVTLARDCARRAQHGALAPIGWTAHRLALVASVTAPDGARYRDVATWPLRAT